MPTPVRSLLPRLRLALIAVLGVLAAVVLTSCSGNRISMLTGTIGTRTLPTLPATTATVTTEAAASPPVTETSAFTVTETETFTEAQPTTVVQTLEIVPPPATTTAPTTSPGITPAGAAAVGAAAAAQSQAETDSSNTEWGWIAFAILAGAVAIGGIVWLVRRHSGGKPAGGASAA